MTIVDANVLLYAVNTASPQHDAAKAWLDDAPSGDARVGLPRLALLASLRIATHPSLFPRPLAAGQALDAIGLWCGAPNVVHPEPGRDFPAAFARTVREGPALGGLAHDAYLAALAIEHGAAVATFDRDSARFPGVRIVVPSARSDDAS